MGPGALVDLELKVDLTALAYVWDARRDVFIDIKSRWVHGALLGHDDLREPVEGEDHGRHQRLGLVVRDKVDELAAGDESQHVDGVTFRFAVGAAVVGFDLPVAQQRLVHTLDRDGLDRRRDQRHPGRQGSHLLRPALQRAAAEASQRRVGLSRLLAQVSQDRGRQEWLRELDEELQGDSGLRGHLRDVEPLELLGPAPAIRFGARVTVDREEGRLLVEPHQIPLDAAFGDLESVVAQSLRDLLGADSPRPHGQVLQEHERSEQLFGHRLHLDFSIRQACDSFCRIVEARARLSLRPALSQKAVTLSPYPTGGPDMRKRQSSPRIRLDHGSLDCEPLVRYWVLKLLSGAGLEKKVAGVLDEFEAVASLLGIEASDWRFDLDRHGNKTVHDLEHRTKRLARLIRELSDKNEPPKEEGRGTLGRNVSALGALIGLSPIERDLLLFGLLLGLHPALKETLAALTEISKADLFRVLAYALDVEPHEVDQALKPKGLLSTSGLVKVDEDELCMSGTSFLKVFRRVQSLLAMPHFDPEAFLEMFARWAPAPALTTGDYPHLGLTTPVLRELMGRALREHVPGVNVLIYGPPGTGKSE